MPPDIVEETRAAREHGGTGRTVVEVKVEDIKPGTDVGRMDEGRKDKGKL